MSSFSDPSGRTFPGTLGTYNASAWLYVHDEDRPHRCVGSLEKDDIIIVVASTIMFEYVISHHRAALCFNRVHEL